MAAKESPVKDVPDDVSVAATAGTRHEDDGTLHVAAAVVHDFTSDADNRKAILEAAKVGRAKKVVDLPQVAQKQLAQAHGCLPLLFVRLMKDFMDTVLVWSEAPDEDEEEDAEVERDENLRFYIGLLQDVGWPSSHYDEYCDLLPGKTHAEGNAAAAPRAVAVGTEWNRRMEEENWYTVLSLPPDEMLEEVYSVVAACNMETQADTSVGVLVNVDFCGKLQAMDDGDREEMARRLLRTASVLRAWAVIPNGTLESVMDMVVGTSGKFTPRFLVDLLRVVRKTCTAEQMVDSVHRMAGMLNEMGDVEYVLRMVGKGTCGFHESHVALMSLLMQKFLDAVRKLEKGTVVKLLSQLDSPSVEHAVTSNVEGLMDKYLTEENVTHAMQTVEAGSKDANGTVQTLLNMFLGGGGGSEGSVVTAEDAM